MKGIYQQFADWVDAKPVDEKYDYLAINGCALALFLIEHGYSSEPRVADNWDDDNGVAHPVPDRVDDALNFLPWTFGALSARLRGEAG